MNAYLEKLQLYYEEEIEGEAYFTRLSARFADPDCRMKLRLLAEVERHAAAGVAPLIAKHGLSPRATAALIASGHADADQTALDWSALMAEMRQSYQGYLAAFEALETMARPEDRNLLSFLTEHEVAALRFLELEDSNPDHSTAPLQAYLATAPDAWRAAAE
jgi:hypothetical protein